jgi:hypothetical protein
VAHARAELLRVKGRISQLEIPDRPMDHQPGYLEWLRLRQSVPRLKKAHATARRKASQRLKKDYKRQLAFLATEYSRRRLLGIR